MFARSVFAVVATMNGTNKAHRPIKTPLIPSTYREKDKPASATQGAEKETGVRLASCKTKAMAANSMRDAAREIANAFFGLKINKADPIKSGNKSINSRYIAMLRSDYGRIVLFKLTNKMTTMAATMQNR